MRAGFIGLGIMGSRMAANLVADGHELTVWNRTGSTAKRWASEHRATVASSPAELGEQSDVVVTMVVDGDQVESVLLGAEGVTAGKGRPLCVDMSTIGPRAATGIAKELGERGVPFLDAPVTGSSPRAEDGTLTIMAGGESADFERARPLFEAMGELIVHVGPVGHGQMVKLINNAVAAANTAVAGEALLLGRQFGLDLDALLEVMSAGSGGSAMLDLKAQPMLRRDYTTLFKLEHMQKDVRLYLEEAQLHDSEALFAQRVHELLDEANRGGHGSDDFAALVEALEERGS
jgi:3-hydroxyisobutyrate dehydrogenase-like beta-hydroxyacid dehydrogenase